MKVLTLEGLNILWQTISGLISPLNESITTVQSNLDDSVSDLTSKINTKVTAQTGKGLSTNDYTTAEKNKLATVEPNANYFVLTVDTELNNTSENPVQNKVINTRFANIEDSLENVTGSINAITNETIDGICNPTT